MKGRDGNKKDGRGVWKIRGIEMGEEWETRRQNVGARKEELIKTID